MDWLQANYIYFLVGILGYIIGKIHGRSDATQELMYMQEAQAQQEAYQQYINSLNQAGEAQ